MSEDRSFPAHQLLDFDWKLKYAVSSSCLATMKKPLLRLELCVSPTPHSENPQPNNEDPLILLSEYSKTQLDDLISQMEAIQKALDESPSN